MKKCHRIYSSRIKSPNGGRRGKELLFIFMHFINFKKSIHFIIKIIHQFARRFLPNVPQL